MSMTPDEVEAVIRVGMCSPKAITEKYCATCERKLAAIAAVQEMRARLVARETDHRAERLRWDRELRHHEGATQAYQELLDEHIGALEALESIRVVVGAPADVSLAGLVEAVQRLRQRAEEAEHGCEVLSVGDPYERLRDTIEAGKTALAQRDEARRDVAEIARAIGCVHHQSMGPDIPGSPADIIDAVRVLRERHAWADDRRLTAEQHAVYLRTERDAYAEQRNESRREVERLRALLDPHRLPAAAQYEGGELSVEIAETDDQVIERLAGCPAEIERLADELTSAEYALECAERERNEARAEVERLRAHVELTSGRCQGCDGSGVVEEVTGGDPAAPTEQPCERCRPVAFESWDAKNSD